MKRPFLIFLLLLSVSCYSQDRIENKIDSLFTGYTSTTPGVAIAVVKDGETVFQKGYGMANLEYDIPISTNTVFNIGSVSKQFVAFATYLLAEEGKIKLDDNIETYFPEIPNYGKPITIKQLLAHTSGLRDQWSLLTLSGYKMDDVISTDHILKLIAKQEGLNFEPGTQFMYSNTGYTLLAEIIKRVTGQSFPDYAQENIFAPLNMNDSQFHDHYEKLIKNRAYSYEKRENTYFKKKLNYMTTGPTGLFTTVEDLAKWTNNFKTSRVGNPALIAAFDSIATLKNGKPVIWSSQPNDTIYHAKGQLHYLHRGFKVISHGGHDAGFRATLTRFPEENLTVIALSNDEHYNMFSNLMALADLFLNFEPEQPGGLASIAKGINSAFDKANLETMTGSYRSEELSTTYTLQVEEGQLIMMHNRLDDVKLKQTGENQFSGVNTFPIEVLFQFDKNNRVTGFTASNFGSKNILFKKIPQQQ